MRSSGKRLLGLGHLVAAIVSFPVAGAAGVLDVAWTAPTTNTDGSRLTDLASYRVYYGTGASPCPGPTFTPVASTTASPTPGQTVSVRLTGLSTGTIYNVSVTAIDINGNQSSCSSVASGTAAVAVSVAPTGGVSFGNVTIGSSVDRVFTVQNTRTGSVSGAASATGAFRVVSGSPFTLPGSGSAQVTVQFSPTSVATATTNVTFSAEGDTLSRQVIGSGIAPDAIAPSLTITQPTTAATFSTATPSLTLAGTASDNAGIALVTWTNNRGGGGTATGTSSWTANVTGLQIGQNVLTVTARDTANLTTSKTLTVTLALAFTFTDDPLVAQANVVRAIHFTELRAAIDLARSVRGLLPFRWTDQVLTAGSSLPRVVHLLELRTALTEAYEAVGKPLPVYTDPSLDPGVTPVRTIHLNEVRAALRSL